MTKLVVHGPFGEGDLHDDLGSHPVRTKARQPGRFGERRLADLEGIEFGAKVEQQFGVEACAHLASKNEIVVVKVSD
jgi:hypothetical protein